MDLDVELVISEARWVNVREEAVGSGGCHVAAVGRCIVEARRGRGLPLVIIVLHVRQVHVPGILVHR
jgi:hypothetical protein